MVLKMDEGDVKNDAKACTRERVREKGGEVCVWGGGVDGEYVEKGAGVVGCA